MEYHTLYASHDKRAEASTMLQSHCNCRACTRCANRSAARGSMRWTLRAHPVVSCLSTIFASLPPAKVLAAKHLMPVCFTCCLHVVTRMSGQCVLELASQPAWKCTCCDRAHTSITGQLASNVHMLIAQQTCHTTAVRHMDSLYRSGGPPLHQGLEGCLPGYGLASHLHFSLLPEGLCNRKLTSIRSVFYMMHFKQKMPPVTHSWVLDA